MNERARELIRILDLKRHPEGGWYREVFRSARQVRVGEGNAAPDPDPGAQGRGVTRSALTTIYFLLMQDEPTSWHSVASDEIWHFLEGAPAELLEQAGSQRQTHRLGPLGGSGEGGDGAVFLAVIPAGHAQMARTLGAFTLVGCTVGPGFDFADFELLAGDAATGPQGTKR